MHKINFTPEEYAQAARSNKISLLLLPLMASKDTLKYMTGMPNSRMITPLGSVESNAQFAPFKADRGSAGSTELKVRELKTYLGNVCEDFVPNDYIQTLLGGNAAILGNGQVQAPTAKMVLACVAKSLGHKLNEVIFTAKRNAEGNTTGDLFDGFTTIAEREIDAANISVDKGNLLVLEEAITEANACDMLKAVERSADPILRAQEKFLYCDPAIADAYNDNYLLTHSGIVYNKAFDQPYVEGSGHRTTIVPLPCLAGSKYMFLTPQFNMVYGYDNTADETNIEVLRKNHWTLSMGAAMFFGTEFRTIDKRYLKVIKLADQA